MTFDTELDRIRCFYSELMNLETARLSFEERFHVLELRFSLEKLLAEERECESTQRCYCFFVAQGGAIRHLEVSSVEAQVALKIKRQESLSRDEKETALKLLRRLA